MLFFLTNGLLINLALRAVKLLSCLLAALPVAKQSLLKLLRKEMATSVSDTASVNNSLADICYRIVNDSTHLITYKTN